MERRTTVEQAEENERARMEADSRRDLARLGAGNELEAVQLAGSYPDTLVEVIFRLRRRPGVRLGLRYPLWDVEAIVATGEPKLYDSIIHGLVWLEEEIAAMPRALPLPDGEGITWLPYPYPDSPPVEARPRRSAP